MQLCNDDICSLPEFAGVYERLGAKKPYIIVETASNTERIAERISVYERAISASPRSNTRSSAISVTPMTVCTI